MKCQSCSKEIEGEPIVIQGQTEINKDGPDTLVCDICFKTYMKKFV